MKSRITANTRKVNTLLLVIVLVLITAVAIVMITGIADNASADFARFYSIETVEKFDSYILQDIVLVRKVSRSRAVRNWFSDEENEEKKIAAYNEMSDYTGLLQSPHLYFGIHESLNEYAVDHDASFEEFVPFNKLDPSVSYDNWYFQCIKSKNEYSLNIDIDKVTDTRRLWINHKVTDGTGITGVFCSSFPFDSVFENLFTRYDNKNVKGYVINKDGIVQMDSTRPEYYTEESMEQIRGVSSDPRFISAIETYLENINGYFESFIQPVVIKLTKRANGYVSIAPIEGTDWSVVTFFNSSSLFSVTYLLPLLIAMLSGFVIYTFAGNALTRRFVLEPLNRLTKSVSEAQSDNSEIFGYNRDDEIGDLARTIREMKDRLSAYNTVLVDAGMEQERQDHLLRAVNMTAAALLSMEGEENFENSLQEGAELIALCMDIDRVYIWKNELKDGVLYHIMQFGWQGDYGSLSNLISEKTAFSYEDIPEWKEKFLEDDYVNGPVSGLSPHEQEWLKPYGMKSLFAIPVFLQERFWGFVSFDDCRQERTLTIDEITILRSASLMMVSAINRNAQAAELQNAYKRMNTVNLAAGILLQSEIDEFITNLYHCLGMLAESVDADRVYIWKNHTKDGQLYCTQLYEWSAGVEPQQGNEYTVDIPYSENIPGWEETLSKGNCVNGPVRKLSSEEQAQLSPQGILSILVVPVFLQDKFWGFVGFDDCRRERVFSDSEETILRSGSLLIANALLRNEMTLNLRTAAARLEAVISNYSGVIWSVNKDNVITLFNGLYLKKIGIEPGFIEGKNLDAARKKNRHLDVIENVQRTFTEGPQEWLSVVDGKSYRAHTTPIFDEYGRPTGVVGSLDEITEMIQLQTDLEDALVKAQAASQAKSDFLSNMSHEMRTPLNAIIGMTLIGKTAADLEKKDTAFEKIDGASNHLLGVINDVLDMSKIEAGKFELSPVEFDFEKLLQKTVNIISFRVEEKQQKLSVHLDKDIPRFLIGDDLRLIQVITNLLSNAVKFTSTDGSIYINTHLVGEKDGLCTVEITVKDTGIGISKEQQNRLFQSFEQAENSTSRKFGGTGLGLAISKHIIKVMGGDIRVESELGQGASFIFTVLLKRGEENAPSLLPERTDHSGIRMLAVDDDPDVTEWFLYIAKQFNIICDTAPDGPEALQLVKNNGPYNIFFIDWKMPGMNGIELSRELNEIDSGKSVIIMISAAEWNVIEQEAKEAGVNDFLSKPLFPSAIADCINKYIGFSESSAEDEAQTDETESLKGYHVLVAEDLEINREIVEAVLESLELDLDFAVNGIDAVEKFSAAPEKYDLIFMDLQMPEMDGLEAARRIRAHDSAKAKEIPIVAMTANVFKEDIENCLEAGMNDHIGKPLDFEKVLEKLREYLLK